LIIHDDEVRKGLSHFVSGAQLSPNRAFEKR
jgi:hypothetical protein